MLNFVMRLSFLLTENGCDTRKEAAELAINPGVPVLGVELTEQPFCIISNTYQNWEFAEDALSEFGEIISMGENMLLEYGDADNGAEWLYFIAIRLKIQTKSSHKTHKSELLRLDFVNLNSWIAIKERQRKS